MIFIQLEKSIYIRILKAVAREMTKIGMRRETLSKLTSKRQEDIKQFVEFVSRDYIQNALRVYFEELKSRRKTLKS